MEFASPAPGGSGCSAYVAKPSWQHDRACPGRTVADVAAVASNIPIFNKVCGGWVTVGGTSVAAPLVAGIYGLAGNAASIRPGYEYRHAAALFDITRGNNACFVPGRERLRRQLPVRREEGLRRPHRPGHAGRHRSFLTRRAR